MEVEEVGGKSVRRTLLEERAAAERREEALALVSVQVKQQF